MRFDPRVLDDAVKAGLVWVTGAQNQRDAHCCLCGGPVLPRLGRRLRVQGDAVGFVCRFCEPGLPTATEARRVREEGGSSQNV